MGVDGNLRSQWLRQDQDISRLRIFGPIATKKNKKLYHTKQETKCTFDSYVMTSSPRTTAEAVPPMVTHGLMTVWPPLTLVSASAAQSWKAMLFAAKLTSENVLEKGRRRKANLKTLNDHGHDNVPLFGGKFLTRGQNHQEVVAVCDAHRVEIAQDVRTCDFALWKKGKKYLVRGVHGIIDSTQNSGQGKSSTKATWKKSIPRINIFPFSHRTTKDYET